MGDTEYKRAGITEITSSTEKHPDGPYYRKQDGVFKWFLLSCIVLFSTILGMLLMSTSIFYAHYTFQYNQHTKAQIGWIVSLHVALAYGGGMVVSAPIKVYGCRPVAFIGAFIVVLGLFLSVYMTSIYTLYITQGALTGIGQCMTENTVFVMLQSHYPGKYRTLATGIGMLGFNIGNFIGPVLIQALIEEHGLQGGLLLFSGICAHLLPISLLFRAPPIRRTRIKIIKTTARSEMKSMGKDLCNFTSLASPSFVLFAIGGGFLYRFVHFGFIQHFSKRAIFGGMTPQEAALYLTIGFICATVSRLATAVIASLKFIDRKAYFAFGALVSTVALSCIFTIPGQTGIRTAAVIEGCSIGLSNTIFPVVLVELQGVENFPRSIGIYHFLVGFAALVATPSMGFVFDKTGNYDYPFILCISCAAASTILTFIVYILHRRGRKRTYEDVL